MKGFNMKSIAKLGKMGLAAMNRDLPSILSGAAIAGLVATAWTTYKAAPKIKEALDKAGGNVEKLKEKYQCEETGSDKLINELAENGATQEEIDGIKERLTPWETFTAVAPHIWKPAMCGVFTAGCVIGANVLNVQRLTMLAGAYKLSENKLKAYEDKAKELLGVEKAEEIHDEAVKDLHAQMVESRVDGDRVVILGDGETVFFDQFSGRYFRSSEDLVWKASNAINKKIAEGDFVCLNDLYDALWLPNTKYGDDFGWCVGYGSRALDLRLSYVTEMIDGKQTAVGIIDYNTNIDRSSFTASLR